ncbi:MAG: hypothetical protein ABFC98_05360 [Candidatus Cloacimonas sp.]
MTRDFSEVMPTLTGIQDNLLQVAVYTDFQPQCVIILEQDPPHLLESLDALRNYANQRKLRFPLLINRKFVNSSLDSYPLEFLDIVTANYQNLFVKEDILKSLQFNPTDLRLQMEREIKSKWLLIRLTVLEQKNSPAQLANILLLTFSNIVPVLKGICYLKDGSVPASMEEMITRTEQIISVKIEAMFDWGSGKKADLKNVQQFLAILEEIMQYLENIDI